MNNNAYDNYDAKRSAFKADRLRKAELELYYDAEISTNPGHFNTETLGDHTKETMQYYRRAEPFDNNAYITDSVVDDKIRQNHAEWVNEVSPWAGTASIIGQTEFSAGDYISFQGLRRPRAVPQVDPWQITEIDEEQLADNKPFLL
jgi:hypothetical protein